MPDRPKFGCTTPACPHRMPCPLHARKPWGSSILSRQARGYGRTYDQLRPRVLEQERWCRLCGTNPSVICDHIVPLAFGGETVRSNLQGLCLACSKKKTSRESAARR